MGLWGFGRVRLEMVGEGSRGWSLRGWWWWCIYMYDLRDTSIHILDFVGFWGFSLGRCVSLSSRIYWNVWNSVSEAQAKRIKMRNTS